MQYAYLKVKIWWLTTILWIYKNVIIGKPLPADDAIYSKQLYNSIQNGRGEHVFYLSDGKINDIIVDYDKDYAIVIINYDNGIMTRCINNQIFQEQVHERRTFV